MESQWQILTREIYLAEHDITLKLLTLKLHLRLTNKVEVTHMIIP